jgi:hypothetical protein
MKVKRHNKIIEIIEKYNVETQEELIEKLRLAGFSVTQATISRDIRELGLIKVLMSNGSYRYMRPDIDSGNGQADTTGEFMFGVTMGYEIKGGKLGKALLDTTISGVAFDMLKTVDMVSDSVFWCSSGFCGKKQPMPVGMGGPALRCRVKIGGR